MVLGCRRGRQRHDHRNFDVHLGTSRLIARSAALGADEALDQLRAKPPPARWLGWRPAALAPGQRQPVACEIPAQRSPPGLI